MVVHDIPVLLFCCHPFQIVQDFLMGKVEGGLREDIQRYRSRVDRGVLPNDLGDESQVVALFLEQDHCIGLGHKM